MKRYSKKVNKKKNFGEFTLINVDTRNNEYI